MLVQRAVIVEDLAQLVWSVVDVILDLSRELVWLEIAVGDVSSS